jgi:hypothetical protein
MGNGYRISDVRLKGKDNLGDEVMDGEYDGVEWTGLSKELGQWQTLINKTTNF